MANLNYNISSQNMITLEEYLKIRLQVTNFLDSPEYKSRKTLYDSLSSVKKIIIDLWAEKIYNHSKEIEPAISSFIKDLVSDSLGKIVGYKVNSQTGLEEIEHCVKDKESIKRKIAQDGTVKYKGNFYQAAKEIKDGVRYTIIIDDDIYLDKVDEYLHSLEELGFRVISFKNQWGERGCQGINVKFKCPNEFDIFEIQFHTPMGYHVKETATRDLYQILRDSKAPLSLRMDANRLRRFFQSTIPEPNKEDLRARDYYFTSRIDKEKGGRSK